MLHTLRHRGRYLMLLVLVALSLGLGSKSKLCFQPGGEVHLEGNHSACGRGEESAADRNWLDKEGQCLDVSLAGELFNRHPGGNHPSPPLPVLPPATPPSRFSDNSTPFLPPLPAIAPRQLFSQQHIRLLI